MNLQRVEDLADPRVADYRSVRDGELLRERGLFVAESRLVVRRLLRDRRFPVRSVFVSPSALEALHRPIEGLPAATPVFVAPRAVLSALAGYSVHQGCLALAERGPATPLDDLLRRSANAAGLLVVLENLADPANLGGVFRSALGFGADGIVLAPQGCDPLYRKAIRVSTGATLTLPFARCSDWPADLEKVRGEGFRLLAFCARPGTGASYDLRSLGSERLRPGRAALLFGAEHAGLTPAVRRLADAEIRIATVPGFDSLNVAIAAGIALHRFSGLPCAS